MQRRQSRDAETSAGVQLDRSFHPNPCTDLSTGSVHRARRGVILAVAIDTPLRRTFDYRAPAEAAGPRARAAGVGAVRAPARRRRGRRTPRPHRRAGRQAALGPRSRRRASRRSTPVCCSCCSGPRTTTATRSAKSSPRPCRRRCASARRCAKRQSCGAHRARPERSARQAAGARGSSARDRRSARASRESPRPISERDGCAASCAAQTRSTRLRRAVRRATPLSAARDVRRARSGPTLNDAQREAVERISAARSEPSPRTCSMA